jgi:hypothetical protein
MARVPAPDPDTALLRVLRAPQGDAHAVAAALECANLDLLARHAATHGLAGVVRARIRDAGVELPAATARALSLQEMAGAASATKVRRLLLATLDALAGVDVRPVLLKGVGLAERVYADPLLRPTTDVDLLLPTVDLDRARSVMPALGLSPEVEADTYYPAHYQHHHAFAGPEGVVELHVRPMANWGEVWEADALLARSVDATFDGRPIRWLRAEDELAYLALHAANHLFARLGWLWDLALYVDVVPGLDWAAVAGTAREAGLPSPAFYAFDAARRLVGARIPDALLDALAPARPALAAPRRLLSERRLLDGWLSDHKAAWAATKLLLADRPDRVALFAARRLVWNARRT